MKKSKILLVGFGSIGRYHLQKISKLSKIIDIVEPDIEKHNYKFLEQPNQIINFYLDLNEIELGNMYEYAVIANWGPDHVKTIEILNKFGVKRFLVEKPLSDSLSDIDSIEKLILGKKIEIISHYQWSYSHLPILLKSKKITEEVGELISVVANGGAKCLATNGIHFLALANVLFSSEPIHSSMLFNNDSINPRNSEFMFLEGNASWRYSNSRYLSVNFFNRSHNAITIMLNFEYGYGIIERENIRIYAINGSDRKLLTSPTRTKNATDLIYQGEAFIDPNQKDGTDVIYDRLNKPLEMFDQLHGIVVARSFLRTLSQSEKYSKIKNEQFEPEGNLEQKWKIS